MKVVQNRIFYYNMLRNKRYETKFGEFTALWRVWMLDIFEVLRQVVLWMLVLEVLLVRFRVWHLRLE